MIETVRYVRKPFPVEEVQVTAENMKDVAEWCGGEIVETPGEAIHIKVDVVQTMNERQTKAFVTDHVLKSTTGYKVYTDKAFHKSFEPEKAEDKTPVEATA